MAYSYASVIMPNDVNPVHDSVPTSLESRTLCYELGDMHQVCVCQVSSLTTNKFQRHLRLILDYAVFN